MNIPFICCQFSDFILSLFSDDRFPTSSYLRLPSTKAANLKSERASCVLPRQTAPLATGPLHHLAIREGRGGAMLGPRAARISRPMTATALTSLCTSHELKSRLLVSRVLLRFLSFFFSLFPVSVSVARGTALGTPRRKWGSGRSPARRSQYTIACRESVRVCLVTLHSSSTFDRQEERWEKKRERERERQRARKGQRERERQPACDGCAASARRFLRWWTRFRKCRGLDRDLVRRAMDRQDHARPRDDARRPPRRRHRRRGHQIGWVDLFLSAAERSAFADPGKVIRGSFSKYLSRIHLYLAAISLEGSREKARKRWRGMSLDFSFRVFRERRLCLQIFVRASLACIFFARVEIVCLLFFCLSNIFSC